MGKDENYKALVESLNLNELDELNNKVNINTEILLNRAKNIVSAYCEPLDDYMVYLKDAINQPIPPSDGELDEWSVKLSSLLYFAGEGVESIGIKEDIAKAYKMDKYNTAYNEISGTISDKSAYADLQSQKEYLVHTIYQRAYKMAKQKVEAGMELLQSIKKVISRRMNSYSLSVVDKSQYK